MRTVHSPAQVRIALVTALSLVASPMTPLMAGQTPPAKPTTQPTKPAAKASATSASSSVTTDGGWPRSFTTASGAQLVLYQPQIASWENQKKLVAYVAASYTATGASKAAIGTLKVEADTSVSVDTRLVNLGGYKIAESTFPTLQKEQLRTVVDEIMQAQPPAERVIGLDRVLAGIDHSQIIPKNTDGLKADPPPIFFSKRPAILVNIDGEPIWSPIRDNDLRYAVNTNWDLFEHGPSKTFYLRDGEGWLQASDVKGPWKPVDDDLPESFKKLPKDGNFADVVASVPGKKIKKDKMPQVFVSFQPAEMILLQGEPNYLLVQGAKQLLWVSNTQSDVFRMGRTGSVYFLVSGRWFAAPDFSGPWKFVTPNLPDDFKKIPLEHPRSRVRASVPGTDEAAEAVLLAQIPQTATVKRDLKPPDVAYAGGTPKFEAIEKTQTVERAVNTDKDVLKVGDLYYMCFQGVWFMSKSPTGPWEVTSTIPSQIYTIPISSPSYPVTYVTVEESNNDAVVFATAMMFTGMMIGWGCAVWGTGWYYPPYAYYGGFYPAYYPRYPTYGYYASYNPWSGAYSRGAFAYGPYGGAGVGARYNPTTGTYSRGAVAYGPYGARGAASAYNPRTGAYGTTRQGSNVYGSWGSTSVARGDQWANTSRVTNKATGTTTRVTQGSGGGSAVTRNPAGTGNASFAGKTGSGDMYAGRDGNVYKNTGEGWQKSDGSGGWNDVQKPSSSELQSRASDAQSRASGAQAGAQDRGGSQTVSQLNSDRSARTQGTQRTDSYQRSGGYSSSYRPSGGASRSGGMSRGGGGRRR